MIERIQFLHEQGAPVNQIDRVDPMLHSACFSIFGSWRKALMATGIKPVRRRWSRERVLKKLKAEHLDRTLFKQ